MKSFGKFVGRFLRFVDDRYGVSTVEYALIVVAVIGVVGVGATALSGAFETLFEDLTEEIAGATDDVATNASGGGDTTTTDTDTTGTTTGTDNQ